MKSVIAVHRTFSLNWIYKIKENGLKKLENKYRSTLFPFPFDHTRMSTYTLLQAKHCSTSTRQLHGKKYHISTTVNKNSFQMVLKTFYSQTYLSFGLRDFWQNGNEWSQHFEKFYYAREEKKMVIST